MRESTSRHWDHETMLVVWLAGVVALISFFSYLRYGDVLLYGDAVAHINIARRVFDSRTPGLLQLGTVWLPLPHLLMIPFLLSDGWWRSGIGGSIPSLIAFVLGAAGIFRLVRGALSSDSTPPGEPQPGGPRCRLDGGGDLCRESQLDLFAGDRHDRGVIPRTVPLGGGAF